MSASAEQTYQVRSARLGDLELLVQLRAQAFPGEPTGAREGLRRQLAGSTGGLLLIAELTGSEPVGFLDVGVSASGASLRALFVVAEHRRRGVGRALLETAEVRLLARGLADLALELPLEDEWLGARLSGLGFEVARKAVFLRREFSSGQSAVPAQAKMAQVLAGAIETGVDVLPAEEVLIARPVRSRRWTLFHLMMTMAALICIANTNIFSPDLIKGAVLPILDVLFVIYFAVLFASWRYARRTDVSSRAERLFGGSGDDAD